MWPAVREALEREVLAGSRLRHVMVAGHSMGAATATLISFAAQKFLDVYRPGVVVSALMAACPNGGLRATRQFGPASVCMRARARYDAAPLEVSATHRRARRRASLLPLQSATPSLQRRTACASTHGASPL